MYYFYKLNIAGTKYGLSWNILKNIGPEKFKKSDPVLPATLKRQGKRQVMLWLA